MKIKITSPDSKEAWIGAGVLALTVIIALAFFLQPAGDPKETKKSTGVEKFKELTEISTTPVNREIRITETTIPEIPDNSTTPKIEVGTIEKCAQGFYDALAYYDTYRLIFNTMYSAKVLDSQEMEDQAIKEREDLEVTVGKLYKVLEDSCGDSVANRWLDGGWG